MWQPKLCLGGRIECGNRKVRGGQCVRVNLPTESLRVELEALLVVSKVVSVADRVQGDDDPKPDNDEDDLSDEEHIKPSSKAATQARRNIRGKMTVEDDDSDFDL